LDGSWKNEILHRNKIERNIIYIQQLKMFIVLVISWVGTAF
jgi:hypothetical protein